MIATQLEDGVRNLAPRLGSNRGRKRRPIIKVPSIEEIVDRCAAEPLDRSIRGIVEVAVNHFSASSPVSSVATATRRHTLTTSLQSCQRSARLR